MFSHDEKQHGIYLSSLLLHPLSVGSIRLHSNDLNDPLLIDPNFLDKPEDARVLVEGRPIAGSLGYPGSVRWQHFKPLNSAWGKKHSAFVTALPQIRVDTLIGSQANYEIKIKITIYLYKIMISYEKYSTSVRWQHCLAPHE